MPVKYYSTPCTDFAIVYLKEDLLFFEKYRDSSFTGPFVRDKEIPHELNSESEYKTAHCTKDRKKYSIKGSWWTNSSCWRKFYKCCFKIVDTAISFKQRFKMYMTNGEISCFYIIEMNWML